MIHEPELTTDNNGEEISVSVAEYLSFWGCDPCYDKAPRLPGDGYTFYNYGPENNSREYLESKLLPAIERQLQDTTLADLDRQNFGLIQKYVKATLAEMADPDREPIINGMARALFVLEWSDREDEQGRHYPGQALEHVAPATPREAYNAAHNLAGRFEQLNGYDIRALLWQAAVADGKPHADPGDKYAEDFGHYLAMQALGHGVGWFDDHARFPLRFPRFTFSWEPEELPCSST
jgi:hypothetical protein